MTDTKTEEKVDTSAFDKPRRRGELTSSKLVRSDIPAPVIDNAEFGPQAFAAVPAEDGTFTIDKDKAQWLHFTKPGGTIPNRPSYTIKAFQPDGRLIQIPFEPQIQNSAAGDKEDAIGLHRARRKGIHVLIDWDSLLPVYCPASDCWAQGNPKFEGFCSPQHANKTLPNRFNEAGEVQQGLMSRNVTTSRVWSA